MWEYIVESNLNDPDSNMSNYYSHPFKHVIIGHYYMPLKHFCDVIRQYWGLINWQQPIGSLHFLTQNANEYSILNI